LKGNKTSTQALKFEKEGKWVSRGIKVLRQREVRDKKGRGLRASLKKAGTDGSEERQVSGVI